VTAARAGVRGSPRRVMVGVAIAIAAAAGSAAAAVPAVRTLSPASFEQRHGIRLVRVAVTAAGGMVDLRLVVTDQDKARALLADPAHGPRLVADGGRRILSAPHRLAHGLSVRQGAGSFLLYPNVAGAVRPGSRLLVAFGDVRVGPLVAR
jgi:hypothetical protein